MHTHLLALGSLRLVDLVVEQPRHAAKASPPDLGQPAAAAAVGGVFVLVLVLVLDGLEGVGSVRWSFGVRVGKVVQELRVVREACGTVAAGGGGRRGAGRGGGRVTEWLRNYYGTALEGLRNGYGQVTHGIATERLTDTERLRNGHGQPGTAKETQ